MTCSTDFKIIIINFWVICVKFSVEFFIYIIIAKLWPNVKIIVDSCQRRILTVVKNCDQRNIITLENSKYKQGLIIVYCYMKTISYCHSHESTYFDGVKVMFVCSIRLLLLLLRFVLHSYNVPRVLFFIVTYRLTNFTFIMKTLINSVSIMMLNTSSLRKYLDFTFIFFVLMHAVII